MHSGEKEDFCLGLRNNVKKGTFWGKLGGFKYERGVNARTEGYRKRTNKRRE